MYYRVIAAHSIANALGPMKSITLPLFHAFTGCDTTSSFAGRAKKRCWESWLSFPDFTGALKKICDNPKDFLNNEIFAIIERYVILIYEKSSQLTDVCVYHLTITLSFIYYINAILYYFIRFIKLARNCSVINLD